MAGGVCAAPDCPNPLGPRSRKWCSTTCAQRVYQRAYRRKQRSGLKVVRDDRKPLPGEVTQKPSYTTTREESLDGRATARRGPGYERFRRTRYPDLLMRGAMSQGEAIRELELEWDGLPGPKPTQGNVSRWMAAYVEDAARGKVLEDHEPDLAEDLGEFTRRYFPKLQVPDFHLEWEEAIDSVVGTGGKLLLLASQRHGKSELLIRYCMRRIAADPNISIGWVSKTANLAERMVGYVRQNLEHNDRFITDVLGQGGSFVPPNRSGLSWTNGEFTVACRTEIRKSPTMEAIGVGGTIVGRDFDLIILDDPQDRARCMSPTQRDKDNEWMFTDFLSRKEEHTGVAFIMSRQHIEDLPGIIIRDHIDDWDVRIYRAHDPLCPLPEKDFEAHQDCVLWPGKRTWKWLWHQKDANEAHFQRNYMNDPKTDATTYITADDIASIRDHTRVVGDIPSGSRLVAGIDPAEAKPVAAVLFGYDGLQRHVIDCGEFSASIVGMREILKLWPSRYGVREFAFEKNMGTAWLQDTEVKRLVAEQRLTIHHHYCVDTETEVLGREGWMSWDEVQVGDEILTLNCDTARSEWKPVREVYRDLYRGPMVQLKSRNIDALCTPDHKWPVAYQHPGYYEAKLVEARNLNTGHRLLRKAPHEDDGRSSPWSDDFVRLIGWSVTEGNYRRSGTGIVIGQSESVNPENTEEIRSLIKRLGATCTEGDNGTGTTTFAVTGFWAERVRAVTENHKHLPMEFISSLDAFQRATLLDVMIRADGWKAGDALCYSSNDEPLCDAVEYLGILEGRATSRSVRHDFRHTHYGVRLFARHHGGRTAYRPEMASEVDFSGTIWCPSTDNGTFFARRGGMTYFTGNTSRINKNSNAIGPISMFQRMRSELPTITIPGGGGEGSDRIERLVRSWLSFDPDWAGHKHADDDLTMASWFPQLVIDSWERPSSGGRMMVDYRSIADGLGGY